MNIQIRPGTCTPNIRNSSIRSHASEGENPTTVEIASKIASVNRPIHCNIHVHMEGKK
jgi:hypothetical protein